MAIIRYTGQEEYDVVNESQDCRGWTAVDQSGNEIGTISDMLVDTERMRVDSVVIDGKSRIAAEDLALRDGRVVVRGIHDRDAYARVDAGAATTGAATYSALADQTQYRQAGHVQGVTRAAADENEITLPIIEEQLVVGKREVERGAVRVRTEVEEKPVEEHVRLREERVHVERRPVDRPLDADAPQAFKEGTFEVTTQAEVPIVEKQARVVEEVVIDKEIAEREETVRDTVRRTDVEVDEIDADATNRRNG